MKANGGLKRLYDRLKPEERFRLALEALARDDEEELDRLGRTCPRKTYSQIDAEYLDLLEASSRVADQFAILWLATVLDYDLSIAAEFGYIGRIQNFVKGYALGANATAKRARPSGRVPFDVDGREPTDEELDEIGFAAAVDGFPKRLRSVTVT